MTSAKDNWPNAKFRVGQKDHLHALGVITASFNQLEFTLFCLFLRYTKLESKLAQRIFVQIQNFQRIDLIRRAAEQRKEDQTTSELLEHFLKAFETLADSRNFLSHSHTILNRLDQPHLTFGKGSKSKPDIPSYAHLTLNEIRKIAEDIHAFTEFGHQLDIWLMAKPTGGKITFYPSGQSFFAPLPEKPPLPEALKSVPHGILPELMNPPQSSET